MLHLESLNGPAAAIAIAAAAAGTAITNNPSVIGWKRHPSPMISGLNPWNLSMLLDLEKDSLQMW